MSDFNQFIALGAVVTEPELKTTRNGKEFTRFRFGYTRGWGESKQKCYVTVITWGKLAEVMAQYGEVGRKYLLTGELSVQDERTDDGYRTNVLVTAYNMKPLTWSDNDKKKSSSDDATDAYADAYAEDATDDAEEEIPF